MKIYTDYQERIRECFAAAFRFLDEHKHPRTEADWKKTVEDSAKYTDPLTVDLIVACVGELEREYKTHQKKERHISELI